MKAMDARTELARQIMHVMIGVFLIAGMLCLWYFTHGWHFIAIFIAWVGVIGYCILINMHALGAKTPFEGLFKFLGARDEFPGEGALWYLLGLVLALSFLDRFLYIIATIYILAVGDGIATIYSYKRTYTRSFFKGRSWYSYLAFIAFTMPVSIVMGIKAIPLIILCAIAESLDLKINDNFLIPLICVIYLNIV
jgi:dolichol kinase